MPHKYADIDHRIGFCNPFNKEYLPIYQDQWLIHNYFILAIRALASKLVEQWLKTVKGEHVVPIQEADIAQIIVNAQTEISSEGLKSEENFEITIKENTDADKKSDNDNDSKDGGTAQEDLESEDHIKENGNVDEEQDTLPVLKITLKDGKQIISQVDDAEVKDELSDSEKAKDKSKSKEKSNDRRSSSSSSKSSSSKHSTKSHTSSDKNKSSHRSSSSSSSSRHKSKDDKSKDKERNSSKSKSDNSRKTSERSSSSSSKTKDDRSLKSSDRDKHKDKEKSHDKDKNQEKNKEKIKDSHKLSNEKLDEKIQTPSIQKLGKIPKLSDVKKEKPSISIEVRKPDEPKPKTVKTFHSKFRKHGLEEEVKPPPSRAALLNKKVTPTLPPTVSIPKRPSPVHNETPPEKKPKTTEPIEKPGSIKLIPPKPKRKYMLLITLRNLLLTFFIFTGDIPSSVIATSSLSSLVTNFIGGKSNMYNLSGSRVFQLLVKNFFQIKCEFIRCFVQYWPASVQSVKWGQRLTLPIDTWCIFTRIRPKIFGRAVGYNRRSRCICDNLRKRKVK